MRPSRLLPPVLTALLASAVVAWPSAAAPAPAAKPAALPPALQALLRRGAGLSIGAVVARGTTSVLEGEGWATTTQTDQIRSSPLQFAVTYGMGADARHLRYVHGFAYVEVPGLARVSGGRGWVRATTGQLGESIAELTDASSVQQLNPVGVVRSLLRYATSITTVGRIVIDRDPTTEFLAELNPSALRGGSSSTGAGALTGGVNLQLYVDGSGLVKYVRYNVGGIITESSEILTAVYPVAVHRPRPGDTISFPRFEHLVSVLTRQDSSGAPGSDSGSGGGSVYIDPSAWLARPLAPATPAVRGVRLP